MVMALYAGITNLLRDFPTVTKSPPLPQLHSCTHPLMHKHTCILTHTPPPHSMWCKNTAERNQEIWWSCPWPFNWAESGAASPTIWLLIWPSFNYSQISGSSNQFVNKQTRKTNCVLMLYWVFCVAFYACVLFGYCAHYVFSVEI